MENQKVKVYNESNLPTADYGSFEELQEDFKIMDLDRLMLLKRAIVERGFNTVLKHGKMKRASSGSLMLIAGSKP